MRAYEFIIEAKKEFDPRDIADVKYAYDEGHTYDEISRLLGIDKNDVTSILGRHYPERKRRSEHLKSALTDGDKEIIVFAFMDGKDISSIADEIGVSPSLVRFVLRDTLGNDELQSEIDRRRTEPRRKIRDKVTPDMIPVMRSGYLDGKSPMQIADEMGNVVGHATVLRTLRNEPDWPELRAKWEDRKRAAKQSRQASTKIYRAGARDNLRSKGPTTRHTYGVRWK